MVAKSQHVDPHQGRPNRTLLPEVALNNPRRNLIVDLHSLGDSALPGRALLAWVLLLGFTLAWAEPTVAQTTQPSAASAVAEKINPMNWRMPSFRLPNFLVRDEEQERIVKRKNGLVTDIKDTASRSWQRTKETFNPARLNPMNLFAGPTPTQPGDGEKKPGFFSSLLSPAAPQPEERVATVNEWLGQERPE